MSESSFKIDRRKFLAATATLGVAGALYHFRGATLSQSPPKKLTRLRAGHFHLGPDMISIGYYSAAQYKSKTIFEWNLETGKAEQFDTMTAVHVIETSHLDDNLSVLSTKRTERLSMFDWKLKKEISATALEPGQFFYGHAVFTADGRFLLMSTIDKTPRGGIDILEVPSLKKVSSHPISRGIVHEIIRLDDSKFLFSVGSKPDTQAAFGIFDLSTSAMEYFDVPNLAPGKSLSMAHMKDCGDRYVANVNVAVAGILQEGAVVSFHKSNHEVKVEIPMASHGFASEILSFDFDPIRQFVWITVPDQKLIVVWNLASDSLAKEIHLPLAPLAVSIIPSLDLVLAAGKTQFFAFDSKTLERREAFESKAPNFLLTGGNTSHTRLV